MIRATLAALCVLALACDDGPAIPKEHPARQKALSERIVGRLQKSGGMSPGERADFALALSEVVVPTHSPRLRLAVAGEDPIVGRGAAVALARILYRREGPDGLVSCWRDDTNPWVRTACLEELGRQAPGARAKLAEDVAATKVPALVARKAELQAALPPVPPARPVLGLLESKDPEERREGLRVLLAHDEAAVQEPGVENALVHLLTDPDPQVTLLVSAVYLRRSLKASPPPPDAAIPDTRTP